MNTSWPAKGVLSFFLPDTKCNISTKTGRPTSPTHCAGISKPHPSWLVCSTVLVVAAQCITYGSRRLTRASTTTVTKQYDNSPAVFGLPKFDARVLLPLHPTSTYMQGGCDTLILPVSSIVTAPPLCELHCASIHLLFCSSCLRLSNACFLTMTVLQHHLPVTTVIEATLLLCRAA